MRTRALRGALAAIAWLGLTAPAATVAQTPHTVEPGESLWSIAVVNGISADELAAANGLPPDAPLVAGEAIQIPPAPSSTGSAGGGSGACTWHCASSLHPHPTDEVVSPEQVGEIAASYGMSPSLVQAMANVESGFDNSAVSTSDARGVMQIIPSTWDYIDEELTGHRLDPTSATANVEAGVIYLHHLYHLAGGDREATVGAYFQGPNLDGLLPETHRYVENVDQRQADLAASGG